MLPNYIVIGAPKCGTSSLCDLLGQHPDVFMSTPKEIHFFGRNDPTKTQAWYEAHFERAAGKAAVGEGSTSYTHPDIIHACAEAIHGLIPACRLIYMVRNPLKRLESDWKMRAHEGWAEGASINDAVGRQPTLITQGAYWTNLNVYRRLFPDDQILVVFLEDFSRDPQAELSRCFAHLGVTPWSGARDAARPRNASAEFSADTRLGRVVRGAPLFSALRGAMPAWLLDAGKAVLTRRREYTVRWEPEVRRRVIASLQDDAAKFLDFCGKKPDYWSYA
jgi:hypothetical protein